MTERTPYRARVHAPGEVLEVLPYDFESPELISGTDRDRLDSADVPTKGQALVHVLMLASLRGLIVRGPVAGARHAYVLVRDWLGEPEPVDRERALAELARRYLAGHAAAGERDLAKWAGLPLRDARAGVGAIASEVEEDEHGLLRLARRPQAAELPPPRLLGSFDPLLHGWASREPVLGAHDRTVVSGGLFRPVALVGGRAVATWKLAGDEVALEPFARIARSDAKALEADAKDVLRFLD